MDCQSTQRLHVSGASPLSTVGHAAHEARHVIEGLQLLDCEFHLRQQIPATVDERETLMAHCTARGMRFYYVEVGEGPPVVLLHPAPLDHHVWLYTLLPLSAHFRVLALDQRCFGRSAKPERPFTIADYGEDLGAVLDALKITAAHILGISLGGIAAQLLALRQPSRVRKMVLIATTAHTTTVQFVHERLERLRSEDFDSWYRFVAGTLFSRAFQATELGRYIVDDFIRRGRQLNRTSMMRFYEALQQFDIAAELPRITAPTLVVAGGQDVTFDLSRRIAEAIPGAAFAPIERSGRNVPLEVPAEFNRLVLDFLMDTPAPTTGHRPA